MSLKWLLNASVITFTCAVIGLAVSLYDTSNIVYQEYVYHCGGPGTQDSVACMEVYHRNKIFYETVLKVSIPALIISGSSILFISLTKKNESK